MGGGPWYGFFLQTGAKSKVNEASQKRSLEFARHITMTTQKVDMLLEGRS